MDHIQLCRAAKYPVPQKVSHLGPAFKSLFARDQDIARFNITIWFLLCEGASGLTDLKRRTDWQSSNERVF